ncbi:MAG: hypothetical protein AAF318_01935 [Pseudomonadota bacterium]
MSEDRAELSSTAIGVVDELTELLPVHTAERLGEHLTAGDVATLRDLVRASVHINYFRRLYIIIID